ncbi:MAG: hypothetical protein ABDH20_13105 [Thermus sp.]
MRAALLALFLLALLPRAGLLGANPPFWFDEDWTLEVGLLSLSDLLRRTALEDLHPPLSYLVLGLWARGLGALGVEAETPLRLLPTLLGSLVPPLLYLALRARGLPHGWAFLGGSVYALVPQGVLQDTEFRMYPLASLLVALALLGAVRGTPLVWGLAAAGALWTHYLAGAVALSLGTSFGWRVLLPLLSLLPWAPALVEQAGRVDEVASWNEPPVRRLPEVGGLLWGVDEPVLVAVGTAFWGLALLGLLWSRPFPWGFPVALGLLALLGFQPVSPRYLPTLLPVLAYGATLGAWKLRGVGAGLLLLMGLSWWALYPWTLLARWGTAWPGLLP